MHSSPSSSGSSRSGSPDTRATSPAPSLFAHKSPEATPLWVPSEGLTPSVLKALFAKHTDTTLDVVISHEDAPCPSWEKATVTSEWGTFQYATTAAGDAMAYQRFLDSNTRPTSPYIRTAPCAAAHLRLFARAGLRAVSAVCLAAANAYAYTLERPPVVFAPLADIYANSLLPAPVPTPADISLDADSDANATAPIAMQGNIPTLAEWDALWAAWDTVTTEMIPPALLHAKPIDLRHKCLFYIGHIPTFLDMLLSKAIGGAPTEPAWFWTIFERGIDPHVDDPDHCHNHSVVPTADADWPSLPAVLAFRDGVRARLRALYADLASGTRPLTRNIARTLVMTHEHEAFHVETLLYMLIQRADGLHAAGQGTLPPPGVSVPDWTRLAEEWARAPQPKEKTVRVPAGHVVLGHNDSEADDFSASESPSVPAAPGHTYGWDNESPARHVPVRAFAAEWRCVTNAEYFAFWVQRGRCPDAFVPRARAATDNETDLSTPIALPPSWILAPDGSVHIRTLFGAVPLSVGAEWPVLASHDGLAAYAASRGGRLPNEPELRRFLDLYSVGYDGGANTGMRSWHPIPGTMGLPEHAGKGCNGGVWEWTATEFATHDGLVPTNLFTGYSADFFDGKHIVALGGSYATLPRLERRTVRNFYQHNYPYPWIGARVVYDD